VNHQHAPGDEGDVKQTSGAIRRVITGVHALHPGKPLWVTELGFPVANPGNSGNVPEVTNQIQKKLVQASFTMMRNNRKRLNISRAFYYNIQDTTQPGWEYHAGLLTFKGNVRPAWTAFSNLAGGEPCPHSPSPC
jgi:exo-beta-1,3-glucanase (GH17 family)